MNVRRLIPDRPLFGLCLLASVVGLIAIWDSGYVRSAAAGSFLPHELKTQFIFLLLAVGLALLCPLVSRKSLPVIGAVSFGIGVSLLLLVRYSPMGHSEGGARRWLVIFGHTMQPSEFVKLAVILFLAAALAGHEKWVKPKRAIRSLWQRLDKIWLPKLARGWPLLLILPVLYFVEGQPDLATAAVIAVCTLAIVVAAGVSWRSISTIVVVAIAFGAAAVYAQPYRLERFARHEARWSAENIHGSGFQPALSEWALARGSLTGVGIGQGQAKQNRLPAATTDFVMTTVGEETGLIGSLAVILLLAAITWRLICLSMRSSDRFSSLILIGIGVWIGAQTCVNIWMVNAHLPPIGIPLPFVSAGGSSLVALWLGIGTAMSVVQRVKNEEVSSDEAGHYGWRNRRARISRA
ncbi:MAG: FtsW/RodA/SpoVE family cell cycle protein [Armatimonadetes bacterium]|nr:FtsW/RodA/SpoVE family cell cycle protein [Armatimonadota bacterium]